MSGVAEILRKHANDLTAEMLKIKSDDFSLVKAAAVDALVEGGLEKDVAEHVLDGLQNQVSPDASKMIQKAAELEREIKVLEKTASYIEDLEAKLEASNARVLDLEKQASIHTELKSLSDSEVFSQSEVEQLKSLPQSTLQKIAHSVDKTPWDMGQRSDRVDATVDPIMNFIMG